MKRPVFILATLLLFVELAVGFAATAQTKPTVTGVKI